MAWLLHNVLKKPSAKLLMLLLSSVVSLSAFAGVSWEVTDASCNGKEDGAIDLTVDGSNGTYTFEWSNGETGEDLVDVAAGSYTIKIFDRDGCIFEETIEVGVEENKPQVRIAGGGKKTKCQGDPPPEVRLFANATDCEDCQYQWSNGTSSQSVKIARSGSFTVTATDVDGCFAEAKAEVEFTTRDCSDDNPNRDDFGTPVVGSFDPNDITGPEGVGEEKWVAIDETLPYKIRFENDPDFATSPAQVVTVRAPIDPDANLFSFRLGSFGFGDFIFDVPEGNTFYSTRLDVADSLGVVVDLTAGLDVTKKEAFWIFESKDPNTGLPPDDALLGFLLVNDTTTRGGEGFVNFTMKPNRVAQTGDTITAFADIVFDKNESLLTNTHTNLVDAFPASSRVNDVTSPADSLTMISVLAEDDFGAPASGVESYDLYVSEGGNSRFELLKADLKIDEEYPFVGEPGEEYCLYSVATDSVGNTESKFLADVCFELQKASVITLLTPAGGEVYCPGDVISATWESIEVQEVDVLLSMNGGGDFIVVGDNLDASDNGFNWSIPLNTSSSTDAIIRVVNTEDAEVFSESGALTIYDHQQVAIQSGTQAACEGSVITLDAGAGYTTYAWSTGELTQTIDVDASGTYTVTVVDANGCTSSDDIDIVIHPLPETPLITAQGPTTFCPGSSVTLEGPEGYEEYLWSSGETTANIVVSTPGDYILTITDANGCSATSQPVTIVVEDTAPPSVDIVAEIEVAADDEQCTAFVTVPLPLVTDNCEVASVTNDFNATDNASGVYPLGTTVVEWTVTDASGNTTTASMSITVIDDQAPGLTVPDDITVSADDGVCEAAVTVPAPAVTDNCEVASVANDFNATDNASGIYPLGTTIVQWTVTDASGNTTTASMSITVIDDQAPGLTVPADITVSADPGVCEAAVTVPAPAVTDNCEVASVANDFNATDNASGIYPLGTTIVQWTVTDASGNTTTASMSITVIDDQAPGLTAPDDITVSADAGVCEAAVTVPAPAVTDNCEVAAVANDFNATDNASGVYPLGTTVVEWTVTDASGNTTTASMTITVIDDQAPGLTVPADITVSADPGVCEAAVTVPAPAVTDNCEVAAVANDFNATDNASGIYPLGTTVVEWTVTDASGNTTTASMSITIIDDQAPGLTAPADITVSADAGVCEAAVTVPTPVVTDNCEVASVANDFNATDNASGIYPLGTTIVQWTVTDASGNTTTASMSITVIDDQAPGLTVPEDITVSADAGVCEAAVTVPTPVVTDNCEVASVANDFNATDNASGIYPLGTTIVQWTVTDASGNTTTASMSITVIDDQAPGLTVPEDITVSADAGVCEAAVNVPAPVVIDNCEVAAVTNDFNATDNASGVYPLGTTVVEWTITDASGNTTMASMSITVIDDQAPGLTVPDDITLSADAGVCEAAVTVPAPAVTDNCEVAAIINDFNATDNASGVYPLGTTVVEWIVTDASGNTTTASMSITVIDDQAPGLTAPDDITVSADAGVCEAAVTVPAPVVTDNCEVAAVTNDFNATDNASGVYPLGTTVVEWTVTDASGNTTTASMSITVIDDQAPRLTVPDDITVSADAGVCEAAVTVPAPAVTDNCEVEAIINDFNATDNASGVYPLGTTVVQWTVTDASGNTTTASMSITVIDDQAPGLTAPDDITVSADAGVCEAAVTAPAPAVTDNCEVEAIINDFNATDNASGVYPLGTTVVQWTVTDASGNTTTASMSITVIDDQAPGLTVPDDITVSADAGVCEAAVTVPAPAVTDNCEVTAVANDFNATDNASGVYPLGTTVVEWTVTDASGNTTTASMSITVIDDQAPGLTVPDDITVSADDGVCEAAVTVPAPAVTDNCEVVAVANDFNATDNASGIYPLGTTIVQWTVTDASGNTTTASMSITVIDDQAPGLTAPDEITVSADPGVCEAAVTVPAPVVTDNCELAAVTNDFNATDNASGVYPLGTTVVEWTVTDASGNTTTASMTITVIDDQAPGLTVPDDITVSADPGVCEAAVTVPAPVVTDNCELAAVTNDFNATDNASGVYPLGTTVVEWTVTDASGNTTTASMSITVIDDQAPGLTVPADITVSADPGVCEAAVTVPAPVVTDNCEVAAVTNDFNATDNASGVYPLGTTVVEWTVTDASGNSTTASMSITVIDDQEPGLTVPADITVSADAGVCEAAVTVPAPVVTDNCEVAAVTNDFNATDNASGIYPLGTTVVEWTVTDASGNTTTASMSITVIDDQAPGLTVPDDITVSADAGVCEAAVTVPAPAVTDNCEVAAVVNDFNATDNASGIYPLGTTVVQWTVTDASGNTTTASMSITVIDDQAPGLTVPDDITVSADAGVCEAAVTVPAPAVTDNCEVASVTNDFNATDNASGVYPVGVTEVLWTVIDASGNVSKDITTVTVIDSEAPTIVVINEIAQSVDPTGCEALVTVPLPVVDDNCGVASVINDYNGTDNASGPYGLGTTVVNWTVTDHAGNISEAITIVEIDDPTAPIIICPNDTAVCAQTMAGSIVSFELPEVSDNCGQWTLQGTHAPGDFFPIGETIVTYTAMDKSGNHADCSFTVTVEPPLPDINIIATELPEYCQGDGLTLTAFAPGAQGYVWASGESGPSITVNANGSYQVMATTPDGCLLTNVYTVVGFDVTSLLSAYTILAEKEVHMHENKVLAGGVGIMETKGKAKIHENTSIEGPRTFVKASKLDLKNESTVTKFVQGIPDISIPLFRSNPYKDGEKVKVEEGETVILHDSIYGKVEVKDGGTVIFEYPSVFLKELKTKENAQIKFVSQTHVFISKKVDFGESTALNPDGHLLRMFVKDKVKVKEGSAIKGVIDTRKELDVKGKAGLTTTMEGMFIAKEVDAKGDVIWSWNEDQNCLDSEPTPFIPQQAKQEAGEGLLLTPGEEGSSIALVVYPNPFEVLVNIEFTPTADEHALMEIFDLQGLRTEVLIDEWVEGGVTKKVVFNPHQLAQGIYFYRLQLGKQRYFGRLVYSK